MFTSLHRSFACVSMEKYHLMPFPLYLSAFMSIMQTSRHSITASTLRALASCMAALWCHVFRLLDAMPSQVRARGSNLAGFGNGGLLRQCGAPSRNIAYSLGVPFFLVPISPIHKHSMPATFQYWSIRRLDAFCPHPCSAEETGGSWSARGKPAIACTQSGRRCWSSYARWLQRPQQRAALPTCN